MIKHILGIPKELEIYDMLVVGYPPAGSQPGLKPMRDKAEMVHHDFCGPEAFRSDEQVRTYIRKIRGVD